MPKPLKISEETISNIEKEGVDTGLKAIHPLSGKKIPILSEKKLYKDPPDFVVLFSWHIASELKSNLKKKGYKGKFIIPLPKPKIES